MSNYSFLFFFILIWNLSASSSEIENQCLVEAKAVALKTYDVCLSAKKSEKIEQLKKEYQSRALQLKNEYENRINSLHETPDESFEISKDSYQDSDQDSPQVSPQVSPPSSESVSEPTVVLKPAPKAVNKKTITPQAVSKNKNEKIKKNLKASHSKKGTHLIKQSSDLKLQKMNQRAEVNEITGQTENLEIMDPSLVQE
jgi:hypothetical protein